MNNQSKLFFIDEIVQKQVHLANEINKPLYMVFIATKPCYIKLASVVHAFEKSKLPFLIVDVGQHYDPELISAQHELNYTQTISVFLGAKGDLLERNEKLHSIMRQMLVELNSKFGLVGQAIPVVSGDTSSAGIIPLIWYLATGIKSIHIEGGLRSFAPDFEWTDNPEKDILNQFTTKWIIKPDLPFPEGIDTRLASICSQLFFAPLPFNAESLMKEGYSESKIVLSGSLSADATMLILKNKPKKSIFEIYPLLKTKKWIRIDIHRRENMSAKRIEAFLRGLKLYQNKEGNIVLVMTNALRAAITKYKLDSLLDDLNNEQLLLTAHWADYSQVIEFVTSEYCLGIYTDSGGLQEETNVLNIKCATCRFATDRPESIFEGKTNVLLPPISPEYIAKGLFAIFIDEIANIGGRNSKLIYGNNVGKKIVDTLAKYTPEKGVIDQIIEY